MITRDMEAQLASRGLKQEEIDKLRPEEAWRIISGEAAVETGPQAERKETSEKTEAPTTASKEVASDWTRERIDALTFENLFELSDTDLRNVVNVHGRSSWRWGIATQALAEDFARRVRSVVDDTAAFDLTAGRRAADERVKNYREYVLDDAKKKLMEALQRENPSQS